MSKYKSKINEGYILYQKDIFINEKIIHLPIYMAELINTEEKVILRTKS